MMAGPELEVIFAAPLAPFTTFGIGGPADVLYLPRRAEDLEKILNLHRSKQERPVCLGGGSNVLISDQGVAEPVVVLKYGLDTLESEETPEGEALIRAGAGLRSSALVARAAERGWADLVFLAGIPGTVGGAAVMNAGWGAQAMSGAVTALKVLGPRGHTRRLDREELDYGYRSLSLEKGSVVLEVELKSGLDDPAQVEARIKEALRRRGQGQPKGVRSAGSFFKNPENDFAGRLIEAAGLKGRRCGQAQVSPVHANFIVNTGSATAEEVMTLAQEVREAVRAEFGITLEPEVRYIGRGGERWPWMES